MTVVLDLVRLFAGVSLLAFAAYTDWRWRRAPNLLWIIVALVGLVLLGVEAALDWPGFVARWPYVAFVPAFAIVIYAFWWLGLVAGGADAKALMALGVLLPFPVVLGGLPVWESPMPAAFSVLGNSLLAFLFIPVSFLVWNLAHGHVRLPHMILGLKREAAGVRRGHVWPMEVVDASGARRSRYFASKMSASEIEETFERIQALGTERVWVTPKVPFMIPLLVGFVVAFVVGDVLTGLLTRILPVGG